MKLRNMIIAAMAATGAIAGQAENLPESDSYGIVTGRITDVPMLLLNTSAVWSVLMKKE